MCPDLEGCFQLTTEFSVAVDLHSLLNDNSLFRFMSLNKTQISLKANKAKQPPDIRKNKQKISTSNQRRLGKKLMPNLQTYLQISSSTVASVTGK